jgi:hypothetical protein
MAADTKPFAVLITKADGLRRVEFQRYATLAEAELNAVALRKHAIDAHAGALDEEPLERATDGA